MKRIYFKLNQKPAILGYVIAFLFFPFLFYTGLRENDVLMIIFSIILLAIITSNLIIFERNGFQFSPSHLTVVSKYKIRVFKITDIEKIDVEFKKIKDYYYVFAKIYLFSKENTIKFEWTEVRAKHCSYKYNINDSNIDDYYCKLTSIDKVNVTIDN